VVNTQSEAIDTSVTHGKEVRDEDEYVLSLLHDGIISVDCLREEQLKESAMQSLLILKKTGFDQVCQTFLIYLHNSSFIGLDGMHFICRLEFCIGNGNAQPAKTVNGNLFYLILFDVLFLDSYMNLQPRVILVLQKHLIKLRVVMYGMACEMISNIGVRFATSVLL